MKLELFRSEFTPNSTIGSLFINGTFECFTLEDCVRAVKVPRLTAIPYGKYKVVITESVRFKRPLPLLLNVPNFTGVRIHTGNVDADTEGCILVGQTKGVDLIGKSRQAFDTFFPKLQAAINIGDEAWLHVNKLEVTNGQK